MVEQDFVAIRERIRGALAPYKAKLEREKPTDGGIISNILWRFRSQPAHHIELLVLEACSELRNKDPDITEADINAIIAKYSKKAQALVAELGDLQPAGLG